MNNDDDLRGSTPVYTAKDILVRLDDKVDKMDLKIDGLQTAVQILVSQNLNERVHQLEANGSKNAQEALRLASEHEQFRNQTDGQLKLLKWLASGGALAAVGMILKLIGVPVPF